LSLKKRVERLEHLIENTPGKKYLHLFVPALFYCGWLKNQTEEQTSLKKQVQSCYPYCCFNHLIGLPTIKYEDDDGNVLEMTMQI